MNPKDPTKEFDPSKPHEGVSAAPVDSTSLEDAKRKVALNTRPAPVASEHPVAAEGVDFSPKTDNPTHAFDGVLTPPSPEAKADPTKMDAKDDPNVTHVPPKKGLDDAGEDKSFDNRNSRTPQGFGGGGISDNTSMLHAGNAMAAGPLDVESQFAKNFGMAQDSHPDSGKIPEGQLLSRSVKDGEMGQVAGAVPSVFAQFPQQAEPSLYPEQDKKAKPLKYTVAISPVHLPGAKSVPFTNGPEFMDVPVGREVDVTEAIYNAIKDSSIPFTARPKG